MATTQDEISEWFDQGVRQGATHMIIVCDTYDHEDYPVYVESGQDPYEMMKAYNGPNMQRVMEVYSLKRDKASQLSEFRSFHYD